MAEFCLACMNRLDGTQLTEADVVLLDDLCEGCGRVVPCIVRYRSPPEKMIWKFQRWKRNRK